MTVTFEQDYVYLIVILVLMLVQVIQWIRLSRLKREIEDLWAQFSILAVSAGGILEKMKKDLDGKQDK